ncbi:MAG: hypothetical protein QOE70_6449 [Chthoniobacter sp.]|jgi:hypothetical protein|nr:hypothetical protein [Chthoniobacter sp.]
MKITFLCSGAEPGRDGVGDYTRAIAGQIEKLGHATQIIALNDHFAGNQEPGERRRFGSFMPWNTRVKFAAEAARRFDPDVVSVQFVPYGFHPKGLCFGTARGLEAIIGERRTQLMLHELWIGEAREYGWKDRIIGALQKHLVLELVERLRPAAVHTSNPIYRALLGRNGVEAQELPLFGNVPISHDPDRGWLLKRIGGARRPNVVLLGLFGTIHPQWSADRLFAAWAAAAGDKTPMILSIGRINAEGAAILRETQERHGVRCIHLGEQSGERVSQFLQTVDLGVATSPGALIGKSGTVAAMLDHGLPVVVTRDDWELRVGPTPAPATHPLLFKLDGRFSAALRAGLPRRPMSSSLRAIATNFLASVRDPRARDLQIAA